MEHFNTYFLATPNQWFFQRPLSKIRIAFLEPLRPSDDFLNYVINGFPTDPFEILEFKDRSRDDPEQNKIYRSTDV